MLRRVMALVLTSSACLSAGCGGDDADAHGDADTDGDADGDADGYADAEADGDVDADTDAEDEADGDADIGPSSCEERVDEFWGEAPDMETRLEVFDLIWTRLAEQHAGFVVAPDVSWDEVRGRYETAVADAESYGRFFPLLSAMVSEVGDVHTFLHSAVVCDTPQTARPPMYIQASWAPWVNLGACVTVTDDGLVVTKVDERNPADLELGDVLLGYDGASWEQNLLEIESCELPICNMYGVRAARSAMEQSRLGSIVANAHLFDTLEVLRRDGSTESIPTEDLLGSSNMECTDQLPVEGVDFPWLAWEPGRDTSGDVTSAVLDHIVPGSRIGFVYIYSYEIGIEPALTAAIEGMMEDTDALIIDHRYNSGGWWPQAYPMLSLLFNQDIDDGCSARSARPAVDTETWSSTTTRLASRTSTSMRRRSTTTPSPCSPAPTRSRQGTSSPTF